ncbi:HigA family addiction module antitoxin [Ekhidna sp.]|uniref:HigA family addiction module antitoxin n=1 Tax=Ekhidna sp. TaxID=2608089 RepID=UPI003298BE20
MIKLNQLKPAKQFGPGHFIKEQMDIREWTQTDLADILGVTLKHVNKILNDKQSISLEMAKILGEVFDTDAKYWINLDTSYRLWLDQTKSEKEVFAEMKADAFERMPIKDMVNKGWIQSFKTKSEMEAVILDFWGWDKLNFGELDKLIESEFCLTRKSEAFSQFNEYYKITWYQMAKVVSKSYSVPKYNKKALTELYNRINEFTIEDNGISNFLKKLQDVGVIFFVLPHLQKTYLDGAAFFNEKNPVVVYTGRYKRIDNFWFTIAHEIAHVLKHLDSKKHFILDNLKDKEDSQDPREVEANDLAGDKLKHNEILEYLEPHLNYLTTDKVEECSEELTIHPSVIIGKLAKEDKVSYRHIHLYNSNVLDEIPIEYQWTKN